MGHHIDMTTGRPAIAFTGDTPWMGLGEQISQGASIDKIARAAGMNWRIESGPVYYRTDSGQLLEFSGKQALYRSDNQCPLQVFTDRYIPFQPREALELWRDIVEGTDAWIATAGVLKEGRTYWALLAIPGDMDIQGDKVLKYYLVASSCDGTLATTVKPTTVRVVCANTLGWSLQDKSNTIKISHSTTVDHAKVHAALADMDSGFAEFRTQACALASRKMTRTEVKDFFRSLYPDIIDRKASKKQPVKRMGGAVSFADLLKGPAELSHTSAIAEENGSDLTGLLGGVVVKKPSRMVERLMAVYETAPGQDTQAARGTAWGAVNAVTRYFDHEGGHNPDTRLNSAWFGAGDVQKQTAMSAALALV